LVVAGWPAMKPKTAGDDEPLVSEARTRLQQLLQRFGLHGLNWTKDGAPALVSPALHVTYWSPRWYTGLDLLPQTQHVGGLTTPSAQSGPPWPELDPWVLITLGTSFGNDVNFFLAAAHAAVQLGCLPILALGNQFSATQVGDLRARLPQQAILVATIAFDSVLPNVAAAIHHGGAGTTHALVTHAVPQIVVPHAAEQMHQAQGVIRSGVGLHLPAKEVTIERLTAALAQALPDLSTLRAAAQGLQAEFAQLGGVPRAAQLVERLTPA
jgi:UDP:flavonoid glycosyltransferase YjiC (YdhE family)